MERNTAFSGPEVQSFRIQPKPETEETRTNRADPLVRISLRDDRGRKYHVSVQASQVGQFIRPQQA